MSMKAQVSHFSHASEFGGVDDCGYEETEVVSKSSWRRWSISTNDFSAYDFPSCLQFRGMALRKLYFHGGLGEGQSFLTPRILNLLSRLGFQSFRLSLAPRISKFARRWIR